MTTVTQDVPRSVRATAYFVRVMAVGGCLFIMIAVASSEAALWMKAVGLTLVAVASLVIAYQSWALLLASKNALFTSIGLLLALCVVLVVMAAKQGDWFAPVIMLTSILISLASLLTPKSRAFFGSETSAPSSAS